MADQIEWFGCSVSTKGLEGTFLLISPNGDERHIRIVVPNASLPAYGQAKQQNADLQKIPDLSAKIIQAWGESEIKSGLEDGRIPLEEIVLDRTSVQIQLLARQFGFVGA